MELEAIRKLSGKKWMIPVLPANLAAGPLSTFIALYILQVGGDALSVAYTFTLASAIAIPSVFVWGYLTDLLNRRKTLIIFSYLFTAALILSLFFVKSIYAVALIYASITFVWSASGVPLNLLVMDNQNKNEWAKDFSLLQMISGIGTTIGLLVSWIVTGVSTLSMLLIVLALFALLSALLAAKLIIEPKMSRIRIDLYEGVHSFMYRLVAIPNMLIRIPHPAGIKNFFKFRGLGSIERNFIIFFYVVSFIFFFGTAVFNTEYTVGLKIYGMTESTIFLIGLIAMAAQTVIFYYYDRLTKDRDGAAIAVAALFSRGASYLAIGVIFLFFVNGPVFYVSNFIFYTFAIGIAYAIYYPASYDMLFKTLGGRKKGSAMGVYGAIAGIGTLTGTFASGIFSVDYGFGMTFIIAALLMYSCSYLFKILPKSTMIS